MKQQLARLTSLADANDWDTLRHEIAAFSRTLGWHPRLAKLLSRLAAARPGQLPRLRLAGQCTLDLLGPKLAQQGLRRGCLWDVSSAGYDSVLADLGTSQADLFILVPWSSRFLAHRDVDAEMVQWRTAWRTLQARGVRWIQLGYDWLSAGPFGHYGSRHADGDVRSIEQLNANLRQELPVEAMFFDLGLPSGDMGRRSFYDRRNYHWFKQPFSDQGLELLAQHLAAVSDSLLGGSRKVLVVDLDNTLWGGEVGEVGAQGIELQGPDGEAYRDFQSYLKGLQKRGVLLTVCSKNWDENARAPFRENSEMVLKETDFSAFRANWSAKSENIVALASELNLGLESVVFIDDNQRECEEVARALPEVAVVHLHGDPSDFVGLLETGMFFETAGLTAEDTGRTESYRAASAREQVREQTGDISDYLDFLQMEASIETVRPETMMRTVQLLGKTNQFNLTTLRHGAEKIQTFLESPGSYVKTLSLRDRFGDLGLVGVLIALPVADSSRLVIDSWVLSCRVFERTVEQRFFKDLLAFAREGSRELWAEYRPTAKNRFVEGLLPSLGFRFAGNSEGGKLYRLDIQEAEAEGLRTFVG